MKNLLLLLSLLPIFISAQENCQGGLEASKIFQANRIGASFSPQGNKFFPWYGYFKVPYTSEDSPYTIYASSPWIGGYMDGQLKISAQTYPNQTYFDLYAGPLLEGAMTLDSNCSHYNKIWNINKDDILHHIEDFDSDGQISDTLLSIFGWPAEGNKFFATVNGFELPDNHHGGWADFFDKNNNGLYEPQLGEYPVIKLRGNYHIAEELMWMVFNDQGPHTESEGAPIGVEIQLTVFGFNCQDNTVLNNALFNTYKVINQNTAKIDSVYFGMWSDYDIGCSTDDYSGCDTLRNTEYAYNKYPRDGDENGYCVTDLTTYGDFPPIQSLTYFSHQMTSYITAKRTFPNFYLPQERYNLLNGVWRDGTPISEYRDGYNPSNTYPETKYLFNGDPRDTTQWSQNSYQPNSSDPSTLSSVYLGQLLPYDVVKLETVYLFNQDSSLDHISQVGFMQYQIDSLLHLINDTILPCSEFPFCYDKKDCVWPGDFDHNGIADHFDLLYWGVMKDSLGMKRDGRINWDGHFADPWSLTLPNGLNAKHGDGNGNSIVNAEDLERNINHYLFTNPYYQKEDHYPEGPEIVLSSNSMNSTGGIRGIEVRTGILLENVLGLAYELEYDTALYYLDPIRIPKCPVDSNIICLHTDAYAPVDPYFETSPRYGFVKTDHQAISIEQDFLLDRIFGGLRLKEGVTLADIPDTVIIRLKNLIALDAQGNDLHIGSGPLAVPKYQTVGYHDPIFSETVVIPNPTNGFISVQTDVETEAQLFTLHGQKVRHISASELESPFDVSNLVPGIYILRILGTGESIKVVVQ